MRDTDIRLSFFLRFVRLCVCACVWPRTQPLTQTNKVMCIENIAEILSTVNEFIEHVYYHRHPSHDALTTRVARICEWGGGG